MMERQKFEYAASDFAPPGEETPEAKSPLTPQETLAAESFFQENLKAIQDYARATGVEFRPGRGWAIDLENKVMTYDPSWFAERQMSPKEAMWASCHEMEHLRDWVSDPAAFERQFARIKVKRRLHLLYNIVDDIFVNRNVDERFPAHRDTKEKLYRERLFPDADMSAAPRHLQYAYALIRERMLPDEACVLDTDVRAEVDKLRNIDGKGTDLIEILTEPGAPTALRYEIIRDYIEPVYEKLFREDAEKKKQEKKGEGAGKGGEPQVGEGDFSDWYDDFENKSLPHPIPDADAAAAVKKESTRVRQKAAGADPGKKAREQFKKENGLNDEEMRELEGPYRNIYREVEPLIAPLRKIFERIIQNRKERVRRLSKLREDGVMMKPEMLAQAYADTVSGVTPRAEAAYETTERDVSKPNDLEVTLIADLSGSMKGEKAAEQCKSAVLIMEALSEFEENLARERAERSVDLRVETEIRGFGSDETDLKAMSGELPFKDRVRVAAALREPNGDSTNDFLSLQAVLASVDNVKKNKMTDGDLRKLVILITDGGSSDMIAAKTAKEKLTEIGVIAKAIQIGEASESDQITFRNIWGADGAGIAKVAYLPEMIESLLSVFLKDI
jgi:uncharacterized protein YegL